MTTVVRIYVRVSVMSTVSIPVAIEDRNVGRRAPTTVLYLVSYKAYALLYKI